LRTDPWRTSIASTMNRRGFMTGLTIPPSLLLRAVQVIE
jgi:hypothetical protein